MRLSLIALGTRYFATIDDIRYEVGNKTSYIGTYRGIMYVQGTYPVLLPKFLISARFVQKKEVVAPLVAWVFLPGDPDDKPSLIQEIPVEMPSEFRADATESPYIHLEHNISFSPLIIQMDGAIKIRMLRNGELHRIGALYVQIAAPPPPAT